MYLLTIKDDLADFFRIGYITLINQSFFHRAKFLVVYFIFLYVLAFSAMTSAQTFDLFNIYQFALKNETTQISKKDLLSQQEVKKQIRANLLPQVRLSGQRKKSELEYKNNLFNSSDITTQESLILTQSVFDYPKILNNQKAAKQLQLAELTHRKTVQDFIYQVIQAYFNLLNNEITLKHNKGYETLIKQHLVDVQEKYDVNKLTQIDLIRTQVSYEKAKVDSKHAINEFNNNKLILSQYINQKPERYDISAVQYQQLNDFVIDDNIETWLNLINNNLDLQILAQQQLIYQKNIAIAKSGHYPTLDFTAVHTTCNPCTTLNPEDEQSYYLQLTIPIFEGLKTNSQVSSARINKDKNTLTQQRQYDKIRQSLLTAYNDMLFYRERIKTFKSLLKISQLKLALVQKKFAAGQSIDDDFIESALDLRDANQDLKYAVNQYILNYFNLKKIVGDLSGKDIEKVNNLLLVKK